MAVYFSDTDFQRTPLNMIFDQHPTEPEHFVRRSKVPKSINDHPMKSIAPTDLINSPEPTEPTDLVNSTEAEEPAEPKKQSLLHEFEEHFAKAGLDLGKKYLPHSTEIVKETVEQHKYARLAKASYDNFDSQGDAIKVQEGLTAPKYSYVNDLKDFKVDEDLSTLDNLVLHNTASGETHVSFRGTTNSITSRPGAVLNDWQINGEIALGSNTTTRVKAADAQMEKVISKYGKDNLTLSGHSQGGNISYEMGVRNDVPSYSFNPAISSTQVTEATEKYGENTAKQLIYKTPLDFASVNAYNLPVDDVKIVSNLKKMDGVVETHSLEQFTPAPKSLEKGVISAERRTIAGSVFHGAGAIMNAGMFAYNTGEDLSKDFNTPGSAFKRVGYSGVDVTKNVYETASDIAIMDTSFALAPETFGASIIVGLGATVINDFAAQHAAQAGKKLVDETEKFGGFIRYGEKTVEHSVWSSVKNTAKKFKKASRSIKHFFGF